MFEMKLFLWGVVGLWAACATLPARGDERTASSAGLVVDRSAIDFGTLARFEARERLLRVTNHGSAPLILLGSDSDCSCLTSETLRRALPPGEATDWRVSVTTCDYVGEVRRSVWLMTDRADAPRTRVAVRYHVVPEVYAEPDLVALGLLGDESLDAAIEIRTFARRPIRLLAVGCDSPYVEVELASDRVSAGAPAKLRVKIHTPVPEGRYRPVIWVETDSEDVPRLRIPLYGESVRGLSSDRREVVFEAVPLGSQETRSVELTWAPPVRVAGLWTSNESVEIQKSERRAGGWVLVLGNNPKLPLGIFRGFLIVEVDDGQARKIRIPFRGRVVGPQVEDAGSKTVARNANAADD